jgi:hypothetical protein
MRLLDGKYITILSCDNPSRFGMQGSKDRCVEGELVNLAAFLQDKQTASREIKTEWMWAHGPLTRRDRLSLACEMKLITVFSSIVPEF